MNARKTNGVRRRRVAAMALACIVAMLASPVCGLSCSGTDCRMHETSFARGEECHGATQTGSSQIRFAKIMVCEVPALTAQTENLWERLQNISRLNAETTAPGAMNLSVPAYFFGEPAQRWRTVREPVQKLTELGSILALRI